MSENFIIRLWKKFFHKCDSQTSSQEQDFVFSEDKKILEECTNKEITEVVIPDNVTKIGSEAFSGCESLTSVVIPDSVTEIGNGAFQFCTSLTSVIIPNSVTEISREAFYGCESLTSVVIPDSVTAIVEEERDYYGDGPYDYGIRGGAFEEAGCEEQVRRDYGHLFIIL